ncbi:MAG: phosphate acetyltransferase [Kiritimatiellae bacterium]|nr:phosphate acetyltransferase [Kiritimatiellia bacterium]
MGLKDRIRAKARTSLKRIVLPEGDEPRTVVAAEIIRKEGLAEPVLLTRESMASPAGAAFSAEVAEAIYALRSHKGVTQEEAKALAADPMYFGMMMVKLGKADGLVSGAIHSTGEMLRPALQLVKTAPGMKLVSSSFLIECRDRSVGKDGFVVYADCVVNPNPDAESLRHIARASADTARTLAGIAEPKIAMLGEVPFDEAVESGANVFIFPDLQAGNICYKITERLCGATGFAVLQGLAMPCNDLSRGCSVEDIVDTVAATAVQSMRPPFLSVS